MDFVTTASDMMEKVITITIGKEAILPHLKEIKKTQRWPRFRTNTIQKVVVRHYLLPRYLVTAIQPRGIIFILPSYVLNNKGILYGCFHNRQHNADKAGHTKWQLGRQL